MLDWNSEEVWEAMPLKIFLNSLMISSWMSTNGMFDTKAGSFLRTMAAISVW